MPKEDKEVHLYRACSSVSLAHTFGNATAIMTNYIESLFTDGYFKTIHTTTKIGYREFDFNRNQDKEMSKKRKPMLVIRPRVVLDNNDAFLADTFKTRRFTDDFRSGDYDELQPFFEDRKRSIYIKYLLNRLTMDFDITIITSTTMEQLNLANYLKNRVRWEMNFPIYTYLEGHTSRKLYELISNDSGIPILDENGNIRRFLDYVNSHSCYPVTYKLKGSTGNDEFFRYYGTSMDTVFRDLSIDEGNKKNQVDDEATITFTVRTEFDAAGLYYYYTKNTAIDDFTDISSFSDDEVVIPVFTVDINYPKTKLPEGYQLYTNVMWHLEDENATEDEVEFGEILSAVMQRLFEYCGKNNIPKEPYIHFEIMCNNYQLVEDRDFKVDLENMKLKILFCRPNVTYRLFIYTNVLYCNKLMASLMDAEEDVNIVSMDASRKDNTRKVYYTEDELEDSGIDKATNLEGQYIKPSYSDEKPNNYYKVYYSKIKRGRTVTDKVILSGKSEELTKNDNIVTNFTLINECIIIAVPVFWNELISAIDDEGIDIMSTMDTDIININGEEYRFYKFGADTIRNYSVVFKFKKRR